MEAYETDLMTKEKMKTFCKFLDDEIGTEYEQNEDDENSWYVMVFDLTMKEVKKIREFEIELGTGSKE